MRLPAKTSVSVSPHPSCLIMVCMGVEGSRGKDSGRQGDGIAVGQYRPAEGKSRVSRREGELHPGKRGRLGGRGRMGVGGSRLEEVA